MTGRTIRVHTDEDMFDVFLSSDRRALGGVGRKNDTSVHAVLVGITKHGESFPNDFWAAKAREYMAQHPDAAPPPNGTDQNCSIM